MIVSDLLQTPGLSLECISGEAGGSNVESVFLAERLFDLMEAPGRSVVVLGGDACAGAERYHFDMALRMAASRDVAAIILTLAPVGGATSTSLHTAHRVGVALLRQTEPINLAGLVVALEARIRGSAELALRRAVQAFQAMSTAQRDADALVADVAAAASADIVLIDQPDAGLSFPVELETERNAWIVVRGATAEARPELVLVGKALADRVAVAAATARRAEELPIRSRAELLSEMLDSTSGVRSALVRRARTMGLPIDGWHLAARIEHANSEEVWEDEVSAYEGRERLARLLLDAVQSGGGTWHAARASDAVILVRMYRKDPGPHAVPEAMKAAERALRATSHQLARAVLYCGVGTAHVGATGLVNSAAEARAAVAASRARNRPNAATAFDSLGLRRTLIEWYGSQNAREAVANVLEPLDRLGGKKAEEAIKTLHVFLDARGSLSRTAEALHLHRNAVAYRIDRIFSQLDVDRENPDDWLLLELACRARRLGLKRFRPRRFPRCWSRYLRPWVPGLLRADAPGTVMGAPEDWPRWAVLLLHVLAAISQFEPRARLREQRGRAETALLLDRSAIYLQVHARLGKAVSLAEQDLAIAEAAYSPTALISVSCGRSSSSPPLSS